MIIDIIKDIFVHFTDCSKNDYTFRSILFLINANKKQVILDHLLDAAFTEVRKNICVFFLRGRVCSRSTINFISFWFPKWSWYVAYFTGWTHRSWPVTTKLPDVQKLFKYFLKKFNNTGISKWKRHRRKVFKVWGQKSP